MENAGSNTANTDVRFTKRQLCYYAIGDFGNNFSWSYVGSYLMFFYSDVFCIPMAAVSLLMLIARGWDAINDPIVGTLADRSKSRWGRYKPWVLFAAPPTAILLILLFWAHPQWNNTSKIVYMYITYGLLVLAYTCVNIPYGSMTSVMTQNTDERGRLSSVRIAFSNIACGSIGVIVIPLVALFGSGDQIKGFLWVTVSFAIIFFLCQIVVFRTCNEVVVPEKSIPYPLGQKLKAVFTNGPFVIAFLGQFVWGFYLHGRNAMFIYYFKYCVGNENLVTVYNLVGLLPLILGCFCFAPIYNRIGNKGHVTGLACVLCGISFIIMFFTSPLYSPVFFYMLAAVSQFFMGMLCTGVFSVIPDTVEYSELKSGIRIDGFMYSFVSLGSKFGIAFGTAGVSLLLARLGYIANAEQTPVVLNTIHHLFTTVPGILAILLGFLFSRYRINRKLFESIMDQLRKRSSAKNSPAVSE